MRTAIPAPISSMPRRAGCLGIVTGVSLETRRAGGAAGGRRWLRVVWPALLANLCIWMTGCQADRGREAVGLVRSNQPAEQLPPPELRRFEYPHVTVYCEDQIDADRVALETRSLWPTAHGGRPVTRERSDAESDGARVVLVVFSADQALPIRPMEAVAALIKATGADSDGHEAASAASEEGGDGGGGGLDAEIRRVVDSLYRAAEEYGVSADTVDRAIFRLSILPLCNPLPRRLGLAEKDHGKLVLPYATDDDIARLVEHARNQIAQEHPIMALALRVCRPPEWWQRLRAKVLRGYLHGLSSWPG